VDHIAAAVAVAEDHTVEAAVAEEDKSSPH
jgi:hypothetical protein